MDTTSIKPEVQNTGYTVGSELDEDVADSDATCINQGQITEMDVTRIKTENQDIGCDTEVGDLQRDITDVSATYINQGQITGMNVIILKTEDENTGYARINDSQENVSDGSATYTKQEQITEMNITCIKTEDQNIDDTYISESQDITYDSATYINQGQITKMDINSIKTELQDTGDKYTISDSQNITNENTTYTNQGQITEIGVTGVKTEDQNIGDTCIGDSQDITYSGSTNINQGQVTEVGVTSVKTEDPNTGCAYAIGLDQQVSDISTIYTYASQGQKTRSEYGCENLTDISDIYTIQGQITATNDGQEHLQINVGNAKRYNTLGNATITNPDQITLSDSGNGQKYEEDSQHHSLDNSAIYSSQGQESKIGDTCIKIEIVDDTEFEDSETYFSQEHVTQMDVTNIETENQNTIHTDVHHSDQDFSDDSASYSSQGHMSVKNYKQTKSQVKSKDSKQCLTRSSDILTNKGQITESVNEQEQNDITDSAEQCAETSKDGASYEQGQTTLSKSKRNAKAGAKNCLDESVEENAKDADISDNCAIVPHMDLVPCTSAETNRLRTKKKMLKGSTVAPVQFKGYRSGQALKKIKPTCTSLLVKHVSRPVCTSIKTAWSTGTKKQYDTYIKNWEMFCAQRKINMLHTPVTSVLEFLTELFDSNVGYSAVNTARSALSSVVSLEDSTQSIESHPLVIRFMKGVFESRPVLPRYKHVWDGNGVLTFLESLSPTHLLSLKQLTLKLATLLAIVTSERCHSLFELRLSDIIWGPQRVIISSASLSGQSVARQHLPIIVLPFFSNKNLCVVHTLSCYIKKSSVVRKGQDELFLQTIRPYAPAGQSTVLRWIRTALKAGGMDIDVFGVHCTWAAATSKATKLLPLSTIFSCAEWSSRPTFQQFYNLAGNSHLHPIYS